MQRKLFQKQAMKHIRNSLETSMQGSTIYMGLFNIVMSEEQHIYIQQQQQRNTENVNSCWLLF